MITKDIMQAFSSSLAVRCHGISAYLTILCDILGGEGGRLEDEEEIVRVTGPPVLTNIG